MTDHIAVLPSVGLDAILHDHTQFLRLPHPRTGVASLFLPYRNDLNGESRTSMLEVQAVTPPNVRSWFLDEEQVIEDGKLLILTPIDPVFLLIPLLQAAYPDGGTLETFKPADDIFEQAISNLSRSSASKDPNIAVPNKDVLTFTSLDFIPRAMEHLCEVKEISSEIIVYRFSMPHLVEYLRGKVSRLSDSEIFSRSRTILRSLAKEGLMEDGKESLLCSGRTKAACDIISQHLPTNTRAALLNTYDFADLDVYLESLRDDLAVPRVVDTNKIKKQPSQVAGDDLKKRKVKDSHGVAKLKKVNVDGMSKISSFFKKD